jgi:hypothetical protein
VFNGDLFSHVMSLGRFQQWPPILSVLFCTGFPLLLDAFV